MENVVYLSDVMSEIVAYFVVGILICMFFLFGEFKFNLRLRNKKADEQRKLDHQRNVLFAFFTFIACWSFGFIFMMNVLGAEHWLSLIPYGFIALGMIALAQQLRQK